VIRIRKAPDVVTVTRKRRETDAADFDILMQKTEAKTRSVRRREPTRERLTATDRERRNKYLRFASWEAFKALYGRG
jgi:hypothetical protein